MTMTTTMAMRDTSSGPACLALLPLGQTGAPEESPTRSIITGKQLVSSGATISQRSPRPVVVLSTWPAVRMFYMGG